MIKKYIQKINICKNTALNLPFFRSQLLIKIEERCDRHEKSRNYSERILQESYDKSLEFYEEIKKKKEVIEQVYRENNKKKELEIENDRLIVLIANANRENIKLNSEVLKNTFDESSDDKIQSRLYYSKEMEKKLKAEYDALENTLSILKGRAVEAKKKKIAEKEIIQNKIKELRQKKEEMLKKNNSISLTDSNLQSHIHENISFSTNFTKYKELEDLTKETLIQISDLKNKQKNAILKTKAANDNIAPFEKELSKRKCDLYKIEAKSIEESYLSLILKDKLSIK